MRFLPLLTAIAVLFPSVSLAAEADELVLLRGDLSYEILDDREADQQGSHIGPSAFSLSATVAGVLTGAADELGLFVRPSGTAGPPYLELQVQDFWCENSRDWQACHARIRAVLLPAQGEPQRFEVEESVDGGLQELAQALQESMLRGLSGLPSAAGLMVARSSTPSDVLRYGWLTRTDGTVVHGVVAEDPSGGLCVVRAGVSTPVALDALVDVDVRDIHLVGARQGGPWLVARFADGQHIGGAVIERASDADGTWVRSLNGVYLLPSSTTAEVTKGRWGDPLACREPTPAATGGWAPSPRDRAPSPRDRVEKPTGALTLVDGRGRSIDSQGFVDDRLYAVDSAHLGDRRWKRYRLTWQRFADRTGEPSVQLAIDDYVAGQRLRVHGNRALMAAGIGTAIASGVVLAILGTESLVNFNLIDDPGRNVASAMAGGGLGVGIGFAIGGQIGLLVAGRRAKGADRYQDLLMVLTLEEAERAVGAAKAGPASDEESWTP